MSFLLQLGLTLVLGHLLSTTIVSVLLHRGLTHGAVGLSPRMRAVAAHAGFWVTGVDAKAWVTMHRLHHRHSDAPEDPHSPRVHGLLGVAWTTLVSYMRVLHGLVGGDAALARVAPDVPHSLPPRLLRFAWFLPPVVHGLLALALGLAMGWWGVALGVALSGEPVLRSWLVNGLGHARGYRNHDTADGSTNNALAAWLVAGEGLQNNHHHAPARADFAHRPGEVDLGFVACRALAAIGLLSLRLEPAWLLPPDREARAPGAR
jgi:stearoyl-CoA desaturase (delta-9 desaturase)